MLVKCLRVNSRVDDGFPEFVNVGVIEESVVDGGLKRERFFIGEMFN